MSCETKESYKFKGSTYVKQNKLIRSKKRPMTRNQTGGIYSKNGNSSCLFRLIYDIYHFSFSVFCNKEYKFHN